VGASGSARFLAASKKFACIASLADPSSAPRTSLARLTKKPVVPVEQRRRLVAGHALPARTWVSCRPAVQ